MKLQGTLFVLGKGGVGKTTVSEALAALAAAGKKRTLLVRIGESLTEAGLRSKTPLRTAAGYDAVDLDSRFAMDEYIQKVVRVRPLVERITGSEVYRKFFAAAPGLPELVLLGRIEAFAREHDRHGESRWETLIVDCPSSGHGLLMLETPFAALRAVPIGPFARLASQIIDWLREDARMALVAIPEEMAVVEAIEFADDLRERTGLAPSLAFLNRMRADAVSPSTRAAIAELNDERSPLDALLVGSAHRALRRSRLETFHLRRLKKGLGLAPVLISEAADGSVDAVAGELAAREPA